MGAQGARSSPGDCSVKIGPTGHEQGVTKRVLRAGLVLCLLLSARVAHGDGAFPASMKLFAPADRPGVVVLATNFGLLSTHDEGKTWDWVCEHGEGNQATQYLMAAPPSQRMYAVTPDGLAHSDDDACQWTLSDDLAAGTVTDVFADPVNPGRVFSLAIFADQAGQPQSGLFVSQDAGKTFGAPRYVVPADAPLYSVEVAASAPDRVYLTTFRATPSPPGAFLLRSDDGGSAWTTIDLRPTTGDRGVRIAAVDPVRPDTIYLRVTGADDGIAVSTDGGATVTLPLLLSMQLTGFLRRANGDLFVSALDGAEGALYRSTDAGKSFTRLPTRLHIQTLAERGARLYLATDDVKDGFALAASDDDGATFTPLLHYRDARPASVCPGLPAMCAASCANLVAIGIFTPASCATSATPVAAADSKSPPPSAGCACTAAQDAQLTPALLLAPALLAVLAARRRRAA
jgi:MYXO-CTERM domain-containing protein